MKPTNEQIIEEARRRAKEKEQERERAKVLVEYVEIDADHHHVLASGRARNVLAKYRGEA